MSLKENFESLSQESAFKKKILLFPAPVRIFHWVLVASLTVTILTGIVPGLGLYLEKPILPIRTVRLLHASAGFIAFAAVIFRTGYAFTSGDYKEFSINIQDIKTIPALLKYYFFMEKDPPPLRTKYNVAQKIIYLSWLLAITYLSLTGILLFHSYFGAKGWSLMVFERILPPQRNRFIRYHITIYMVISIFTHVYLAHTEDIAKLQAMFTGWIRVKSKKN